MLIPKDNLPSLNGFRAVSIALVIGAHAAHSIGFPTEWAGPSRYMFNGQLGVSIFFVLSGFLITFLLAQEEQKFGNISLRAFYARRFIRILPVYFAFIVALVVLDHSASLRFSPCRYATTLTFTKNYGCAGWVDGHLWSLSVEEQFYCLWPAALALLPVRWRWRAALFLILAAPLFRVAFYVTGHSELFHYSFMTNADALMIGSLCGLVVAARPERVQAFMKYWPALARTVCVCAIYLVWTLQNRFALAQFTVPFGLTLQSLAAAYLIVSYALVEGGVAYRLLNLRVVRYVGVLSYSLYIWQQPFFDTDELFGHTLSPLIQPFPMNIVAALTVAALSYHGFEMPLLTLRKRFRRT